MCTRNGSLPSRNGRAFYIPFVTEVDSDAEIVIGAEKLDNLFSKVVDIDRNVIESGFFQP